LTKFALDEESLDIDDQDVNENDYDDTTNADGTTAVDESDYDDGDDAATQNVNEVVVEIKPKVVEVKNPVDTVKATEPDSPYVVLYRRFRPHKFSEIIGQDSTVKALRSAVINHKAANVYLFSGERGTGKTTTARVLASALNCPFVRPDGEPCGVCDLCVNVHAGNGSDGVTELDAASNSSVDDARRIINEIQFAHGSKKNIYIIDEVHLLSKQANGTLLKTLEEPPANVIFILCTTNPERLEPAVRSRATAFSFHELDDTTMQGLIKEVAAEAGIEVTDEQIAGVVRRGRGSARDALSALESLSLNTDVVVEYDNHASAITKAVGDKSVSDIIIAVAKAIDGGLSVSEIATSLLAYWRSMILVLNAPEIVKLTDAEFDSVLDVAEKMGTDKTIHMLRKLGEAHGSLLQGDPRVMIETTLIQFVLPHNDAAALRDLNQKLDSVAGDVSELRKRPASSPFNSEPGTKKDNWLDDSEPKKDTKKADSVVENPATKPEEKTAVAASSIEIISDPDDLIDAIFENVPKKVQLSLSELEVDTKNTTRKLLVLKSHKGITDDEFELLEKAVAKVDPREFDLDED
jgi:DNA polymerase-3 subunit gamma/tau